MFKHNAKHIYYKEKAPTKLKYDTLLTEDSKSGYQFYQHYFENSAIVCFTSESNAAIFNWLKSHEDKKIFVIADGAAFGSEIDRVMKLRSFPNIRLCLPESFEWLILKSGIINSVDMKKVDDPGNYIDSATYFSWENFFERYLIDITVNTPFQYAKREINPVYLGEINAEKIIKEISIE